MGEGRGEGKLKPMRTIHLDTIDSTNEEAKRRFLAGEITGLTCLSARCQTAGKGTQGRRWSSPEGAGIYLSVIHPGVDNEIPATTLFTLAAGVACAETLKNTTNLDVRLKPVNDLYIDGRKLGGILTETLIQQGKVRALITGVGINVRQRDHELDRDGIQPISLEELLPPHHFERLLADEIIDALAQSIDAWHTKIFQHRITEVESAWKRHQLPDTHLPIGC